MYCIHNKDNTLQQNAVLARIIKGLPDDPDPSQGQIWWQGDGIYPVQQFFWETSELEKEKDMKDRTK